VGGVGAEAKEAWSWNTIEGVESTVEKLCLNDLDLVSAIRSDLIRSTSSALSGTPGESERDGAGDP